MAARPTPFGLFAATAVGRLGDRTRLEVEGREARRRSTRLDLDFLLALTEALGRDPVLRGSVALRPNSSLYRIGDGWRYVETGLEGRERVFRLVSVEGSPELDRVVERAGPGATLAELAASIVDQEIGDDEAKAFLGELVDAQILVPDLPLPLTTHDPASDLVGTLAALAPTRGIAACLDTARAELAATDAGGLGWPPARYHSIADGLAELPVRPEPGRLFQIDLVRLAPRAELGPRVLAEVQRGLDLLHRMEPVRTSSLVAFRDAFEERYGQREVGLCEALDEESGIGFPAWAGEGTGREPLLAGIRFPAPEEEIAWRGRDRHLLRLLAEALATGGREIALDERDVERLTERERRPLPRAFTVALRVAAASAEALDRGEFRILCEAASGPSGAHYLGRFCHADAELARRVGGFLRAEEAIDPEAIFAEIVHLPEGRVGNILVRPPLRGYEIPFLGDSGVSGDRQIPLADLTISVQRGEIVLRSIRLGRRVVPRLTSAHNYFQRGLGLYRFLGLLQQQGTSGGAAWSWGPLATAPFLPRVVVGRVVLAAARWNLGGDELAALGKATGAAGFAAVTRWRAGRGIPRFAFVAEAEGELLVDFDSVLSVDAWLHRLRGREVVELKEMLPSPAELCANGEEGRYVHEVLLAFLDEAGGGGDAAATAPAARAAPAIRRSFPPGSDWLSAKLYGGSATLDRLLRERLVSEIGALVDGGSADRWFFVRYADPRTHLRIRLHGEPRRLLGEVWPRLAAVAEELHAAGLLASVELDTYEREIERYGGAASIELVERVFHHDSDAVAEILPGLEPGQAGEEERWQLALLGVDRLLDDFRLDAAEKLVLVEELRRAFGREHREDADLRRSLAEGFRRHERAVSTLLGGASGLPPGLEPGRLAFARRSAALGGITDRLVALARAGSLSVPLGGLAASLAHMFLNRILVSSHRRQELVLHDALLRGYRSARARAWGRARDVSGD